MRKTALAVIAIAVPAAGILTSASAQTPRGAGAGATRQALAGGHDFDARNARRVNVRPDSEQAAAIRDMPDSSVQWDPRQGAPASVGRTRGYLTAASGADPDAIARTYLKGHKRLFKLSDAEVGSLTRTAEYTTAHNGVTQLVLGQTDAGREVFGVDAAFVIDKSGRLVAQNGVLDPDAQAAAPATLAAGDAVRAAADAAGATASGPLTLRSAQSGAGHVTTFSNPYAASLAAPRAIRAELVTFPMPAGEAARVAWKVAMEVSDSEDFETVVDARSGDVLYRHNGYADAAPEGNVYTTQDPVPLSGQALTPFSGIDGSWVAGTTTQGNNVNAYEDRDANNAIDAHRVTTPASPDPNFQRFLAGFPNAYEVGANAGTTAGIDADRDAAVDQLFYWVNFAHDYYYGLGFNEVSRNFQTNNFGRGGAGNDPVLAEAFNGWGDNTGTQKLCQDSAMPPNPILCRNNANFNTPADGTSPRLQVYVGSAPYPNRLSEMEGDTILHEYGHGVSNRLVGGGTLGGGTQTGGMGEGWGDFFATSVFNDPVIFEYSGGTTTTSGFRRVRYDTSPLKYSNLCFTDLAKTNAGCEVHNDGEIWATALWAMRTKLIAKNAATGKAIAERLVVDGMKGLGSNPTFLTGRDAILAADQTNNAGANECLIWSVFAAREMGFSATTGAAQALGTTATDVPADCNVTASAGGPYSTPEGTPKVLSAAGSTAGSSAGPLTYAWDFDNDGDFDDATGVSPTFTNVGDNGVFPVKVKVTGNNGDGFSAISAPTNVTVTNVNPTVNTINQNGPKPEGSPVTISGTITDPGWLDTLTATISWGDGTPTAALSGTTENVAPDATFSYSGVTHTYGDNGVYTIHICGSDDDGGSNCRDQNVTITNVAPTVNTISHNGPKPENTAVAISGTITDPGWLDTLTATVNWGEPGGSAVPLSGTTENIAPDATFTYTNVSHTYGDDGTFTITVCGLDDDGGSNCAMTSVTITNVNPTATIDETGTTNVNGTPVFFSHVGVPVALKGNATDPGSDDLTLRWNWDDGGSPIDASLFSPNNPAIVPDPDPSPTINPRNVNFNQNHAFGLACVYDVGFSALDDDNGVGSDTVKVLITGSSANHDKSAGFWSHEYQSPSGNEIDPITLACYLEITGFVSKVFDEARSAATFAAALNVLNDGPTGAKDRFDRVLLTNWLNFANGAFEYNELMDTNANGIPDTAFSVAMANAEAVRLNPASTSAQIDAQRKILQSFDS